MKWQRIRSFYYLGVVAYFIFVILVTSMIMFEYGGCSIRPVERCSDMDTSVLKVLIGIFVICLIALELVQVAVSFKRYIASAENIVQNVIIIHNSRNASPCLSLLACPPLMLRIQNVIIILSSNWQGRSDAMTLYHQSHPISNIKYSEY